MKLLVISICLLILGLTYSYGQDYITIKGRILDKITSEAVPYAHVSVKNQSIGTISNSEGEFDFHFPSRFKYDSLLISFVGYQSFSININQLTLTVSNIFYLEPTSSLLEEIEVKHSRITAKEVIERAISKIPENYPSSPYLMKGFFRDWKSVYYNNKQRADEKLLLEAAVNIYDPGYFLKGKKKLEETYIKEIRRGELPDSPKGGKGWNYYNSLFSNILLNNYIKYPQSKDPTMDDALFAFPNAFRFSFDHTLSKGNQIVINATHPQHPLLYTLFVNQADYAFTRIDLTKGDSVVSSNGQYQLSYINNTQRFQKWNGKWYLSYKRHQWEVDKVNQETKEHIQKEQYFIELLVNEVNLAQDKSLPGDLGQLMDRRKPLEFQIRPYNENFWRTYNIIKQHPSDLFPSSALSNAGSNYMFSKSARQDSYELPVQMDEFSQWNFTREDTLLGSLNPMRNCYDVIFYRLNLDINPQTQTVKGSTEIHFIVTHATKRLQLDLNKQLGISAIWLNSQQLSFTRQFNSVFVDFPISLLPKSQISITVDFEGTPLQPIWTIPQYGAFVWAKDEQGNPWFQSICQGSGANGWWPNKDHLSDKADSLMLTVTTPASLKVIANGTLTKEQPLPNGKITYTWKASYPMLTYNVAINAGNYVPITATYNNGSTVLPLAFYVLEENRAAGERAFQLVKPMLDVYESYFGEYPFPKDGFKLVQTPFPMEHQSCVAVGKDLEEDIILHEAAHEWWGNSVSCVDFAELWIHEAFATYAVALFKEKNSSKQKAHAYFEYLKTQVSNKYPLIGKPGIKHIHYDITDMYSKGALMLHTLRNVIDNDSLWFSIIKGIQHDFKYKSITTEELINYFSLKTKADYTYVFNQYLRHTSIPELQISVQQKDGQSYMQYRWKTNEPNFRMPVKINTGGKSVLIHPTEQYQRIAIKTNQAKDIQVETGFYIKLSVLPK